MSTIVQKARTFPVRTQRNLALWLAGAALVAALALVLVLSVSGSEVERAAPATGPASAATGERDDGRTEWRTPGLAAVQPPRVQSPGPQRRDGGPEKSTRGPTPFSGPR